MNYNSAIGTVIWGLAGLVSGCSVAPANEEAPIVIAEDSADNTRRLVQYVKKMTPVMQTPRGEFYVLRLPGIGANRWTVTLLNESLEIHNYSDEIDWFNDYTGDGTLDSRDYRFTQRSMQMAYERSVRTLLEVLDKREETIEQLRSQIPAEHPSFIDLEIKARTVAEFVERSGTRCSEPRQEAWTELWYEIMRGVKVQVQIFSRNIHADGIEYELAVERANGLLESLTILPNPQQNSIQDHREQFQFHDYNGIHGFCDEAVLPMIQGCFDAPDVAQYEYERTLDILVRAIEHGQ